MGRLWILHVFKIFLVEKPSSYNCKQLRWAIICVSELSVAVLAVILSGKILTLSLNPPPFNSITSLSWLVLQNQYKPATSDMNCLRLSVWLLSNADFTEQCSTSLSLTSSCLIRSDKDASYWLLGGSCGVWPSLRVTRPASVSSFYLLYFLTVR